MLFCLLVYNLYWKKKLIISKTVGLKNIFIFDYNFYLNIFLIYFGVKNIKRFIWCFCLYLVADEIFQKNKHLNSSSKMTLICLFYQARSSRELYRGKKNLLCVAWQYNINLNINNDVGFYVHIFNCLTIPILIVIYNDFILWRVFSLWETSFKRTPLRLVRPRDCLECFHY